MAILVYASSAEGKLKKSAFEVVTYGKKAAAILGCEVHALVLGAAEDAGKLGEYGAAKVFHLSDAGLENFDSQTHANVTAQVADKIGATLVLCAHDSFGKSLVGRLAVRLNAGAVSGANSLPSMDGGFAVNKNVFSGKAIATYTISSDKRVISVMGNTFPPEVVGNAVQLESIDVTIPANRVRVKEVKTVKGTVPLPEAELVVSAGRGVKASENWGIIEELANTISATTACSRPVADMGWRPHHEHVGQTGVAIRPNLYIAIGISGAIQHLAGVNQSKTIVVINKDPEAPFFKAADYGVVGDLFDVVPKLTAAIKKHQSS